jgi:VanZ family protein
VAWFHPRVPAAKRFLRYWGPVLAWTVVIFTGSSDSSSGKRTSRIIGPILHWLFPGFSPETVEIGVVLVRKCAHLMEYAILAALAWRALERPMRGEARPWSRRHACGAFLIAGLYAISDEFHQTFVANRQGSAWDVLVDATGACLALLALWWLRARSGPRNSLVPGDGPASNQPGC